MISRSLSHTHVTDQSILLQVCPHAGPITTSHKNMVGEEVDAWQRTGELAGAGLIVVADIGHNVIKFQYFAPLVLLAKPSIEGDFGNVE